MSLISFVILLLLNHPVFAQDTLDAIEVSAEKNVNDFSLGSSTKFSTQDLEKEPLSLVAPLLKGSSGVIVNQLGGPGGQTSIFSRGTESRHVVFTLDKLKLNDSSLDSRQFNSAFFTTGFIRDMQFFKGPQAVLFGPDAFGGLMDMRTRKGESAPETRVNLRGGSFGTIEATVARDWKSEKSRGTLTANSLHTDGISSLNKKTSKATERDGADITQISSSSNHQWSDKVDTDLLFSYLNGFSEFDGFSDNSYDRSFNSQYIAQQKTNLQLSKSTSTSLRSGLNRNQRTIKTLALGQEGFASDLIQNELLIRHDVGSLSTLAGLANETEKINIKQKNKDFDLNSVFLQTSYRLGALKLSAGGRGDHHSKYGNILTGSSGISYGFQDQTISVQYSRGYKPPSLYNLYAPFSGNTDLEPESNHAWEASWLLQKEKLETEVTFFQNRLSNLVTFSPVTYKFFNQDRFIAEGVELNAKWKEEKFEIRPSFTHQNFRKNESPVLRRPRNFAQLVLAYLPSETMEFSIRGRWYDSRRDTYNYPSSKKIHGFETLDLGYTQVMGAFDFGAQLINLLNRDYEEVYGYSSMPRSIFVSTGYRF